MKLIPRDIETVIKKTTRQYPVIVITGPRQSGKTILVRSIFNHLPYYNMEDPATRQMIIQDTKQFIVDNPKGAVIDEAQRYPDLFSYLLPTVDHPGFRGKYILTGSNQFELIEKITQSLAGRAALFRLLPFSFHELYVGKKTVYDADRQIIHGFYPGVYSKRMNPILAYRNYYETYIDRDLKQITHLHNLSQFQKFVKLIAGRISQVFSASTLSGEIGVSAPTIQSWTSILEASYIIFFLQPYYENIRKRVIKSPKLYFYDVGLASYLLGIESVSQLSRDPLRAFLFENMIVADLLKQRINKAMDQNFYYYRDNNSNEVDILIKTGSKYHAVEIKSSRTFHPDFLKGLVYIKKIIPEKIASATLIYNGDQEQAISTIRVLNYKNCSNFMNQLK